MTGGEIFNTWEDLENCHADTEEFFIEHVAKYSVLNADLVPYKFHKTKGFDVTKLLDDASYGKYFRRLVNFIETESAPDAWVVFYATTSAVKSLFDRFAPDWNVPKNNLDLKPDGANHFNHFHIFRRGQRKVLLSPFLTGQHPQPMKDHIDILVDAMKNFEEKLSLN